MPKGATSGISHLSPNSPDIPGRPAEPVLRAHTFLHREYSSLVIPTLSAEKEVEKRRAPDVGL